MICLQFYSSVGRGAYFPGRNGSWIEIPIDTLHLLHYFKAITHSRSLFAWQWISTYLKGVHDQLSEKPTGDVVELNGPVPGGERETWENVKGLQLMEPIVLIQAFFICDFHGVPENQLAWKELICSWPRTGTIKDLELWPNELFPQTHTKAGTIYVT